ncbi:MAG: hypothetical protein ABI999_07060 [Acidobacteriota bacterium]
MAKNVKMVFFLVITFGAITSLRAQQPSQPLLDNILDKAGEETFKYFDSFKNLLSEETKTIETFDKHGEIKKTKTIKSTFLVYQLTKDETRSVEFRNVVSVDGKPLDNADKRTQDFFTKVSSAESSSKELEQLYKESSRYDGDLVVDGLTLFQSLVLAKNLRPLFAFSYVGTKVKDGASVYEIAYQQTKGSPDISINNKKNPNSGKSGFDYEIDTDSNRELNGRLRGTLWIDASTFQIRGEHRELTVQPDAVGKPMPVIVNDFEFQSSDFGILTPKRITHIQSRLVEKGQEATKEIRLTLDYANFSRPDVEVKSSEVKNSPKP